MIDLVMTYVDSRDKIWNRSYLTYSRIEKVKYDKNSNRYRSWDNINYILRSVDECVPFINNIYLIVESETQIPKCINTDIVKIVYHKDIIPDEFLPTFNSNTIEMFMYRIPGLSENFIYMNDDMLFINKMSVNDYYDNDMNPRVFVREEPIKHKNPYTLSLITTLNLVNKENSEYYLPYKNWMLRSDHAPNPMKVSLWDYYWKKYNTELSESISRFRKPTNITQELSNYHYYMYYISNNIDCPCYRNSKYFDFAWGSSYDFKEILYDNKISTTCINDSGVIDFEIYKNVINEILDKRFPNKCKYEK